MRVHLVDGTYELFRHFYAMPPHRTAAGEEVAATRGVLGSMLGLISQGATHLGVATDHVIESFRNDLWPGYKDGSGVDADLKAQFPLLEDALEAMGVRVWAMVEDEADDALASAAAVAAADEQVEEVLVCTPDKDLGQCVGGKVVQLDRRHNVRYDAAAVEAKFGVDPVSIPDYLALVGDSADGFPGLAGWGAKSAAAVLARYVHLEAIPPAAGQWEVSVRNSPNLAAILAAQREQALLFRSLATLRRDCPVGTVDEWRWRGPTEAFVDMCERLEAPELPGRARATFAGAVTRNAPAGGG
ncbi:MAG TPA: 5'-3' exonuclease H3TH domain-containing protein [Acidimicrobiales bacterium]|nr:5'-3' exonuclease H3TH domain-containing protein [Acidimicrobiales bacterium]